MKSSRGPLVTVIAVNYNGKELLGPLLESVRQQSYGHREVIVVDNGSTDGSLEYLRQEFPEVRLLPQAENLGFAGGNNAGIKAARGEYVALINNDTVAEPGWLEALVETALGDPEVAAVGSKILFFRPFLPIRLRLETPPSAGLMVAEESGVVGCDYTKRVFPEGFHHGVDLDGKKVWICLEDALIYLPVEEVDRGARLRLILGTAGGAEGMPVRVEVGSTPVGQVEVAATLEEFEMEVPAEVVAREPFDLINNAGAALSPEGNAADRGIYEPDRGQWDREEDLEAICGAAVLLRKSALVEVGYFDFDFFMYYEDADLSWRLRNHGYRLRYQPSSRIRHLHAASSIEWSPMFIFHTARNKVLMIAKNGRLRAFLRAYGFELLFLGKLLAQALRRRPHAGRDFRLRLRVHRSLLWQIPRAFLKRWGWIGQGW